MELNDLRYFVEVAKLENINKASEILNISPGALSKAVARLESELEVPLFSRERQRIKLTHNGAQLMIKAQQIVNMEEDARTSIGKNNTLNVTVAGEEMLLGGYSLNIISRLRKTPFSVAYEFKSMKEEDVFHKLKTGEIHIGFTTTEKNGFKSIEVGKSEFQTVVGKKHPLYQLANQVIPVEQVLKHGFLIPGDNVLGNVKTTVSTDGWRDDQFPRTILAKTQSLQTLISLLEEGVGVAYLPDYFIKSLDVKVLNISGCPYSCEQTILMTAFKPENLGWLNQIF